MFRKSQKEKTPKFKASGEPNPEASTEETRSEKEQPADKNKHEKNAEPKREKGKFADMFRKAPKEKSSSPALTVTKAESDEEDAQEEEKTSGQTRENLKEESKLSASSDSLSEHSSKEKGGIFSGLFKKSPKPAEIAQTDQDEQSLHGDLSASNDSLSENSSKEKGFFSGILRKSPKTPGEGTSGQDKESLQAETSASNDNLTENSTKEKGGVFSAMFRKTPKLSEGNQMDEAAEPLKGELSASTDSLSENKEKGGLFSGLLKKTPKTTGEDVSSDTELTASNDSLSDNKQEKSGGLFSGLLKKTPKASGERSKSPDRETQKELSASNDSLSENSSKEKNIFSNIFKRPHKSTESPTVEKDSEESCDKKLSGSSENITDPKDRETQKKLSASNDSLSENSSKEKNIFSNIFKRPQKPTESPSAEKDSEESCDKKLSRSSENITDPKEKKESFAEMFKRSASIEFDFFDEDKGGLFSGLKKAPKVSGEEDGEEDKELSASTDSLTENSNTKEKNIFSGMFKKPPKPADEESGEGNKLSVSCENLVTKEKTGGFAGIFKKSPKPYPRFATNQDPLSDSNQLSDSLDSLTEIGEEAISAELLSSNENLEAASPEPEKKSVFAGLFRRTPKNEEPQDSEEAEAPRGGRLRRKRTIKKKQRVVSFRVKQTVPRIPKRNLALQSSDKLPEIEEAVEALELEDLNPVQESTVEVQPVEMAAFPTEENPVESNPEHQELMEWWKSVKGWTEWNETTAFEEDDEQMAMEQAADRVFMAARLFVHLFNQRGASLQQRILELLSLADAADHFHKKTTTAAVGGGVASVAGSITTITGLILAPFTFGASIIVTAVGIGVATAGSIASATANITDTVHSNMDRKKLEKMIQDYQEEIKDIRECLEFVQEGMDTLQGWDFEKFSQSAASKAMNHNIKHVMKEGGRAGKALMINTDKLISTVQVLGAAGGVAKAAQAISVTTGVMSALFLALDIFFLAKDSHKLRKGAKTKFASKIRDVCKDLQDGLLELNKVKTQLQKTMDGIEVEEFEEFEEVEVEVEDDLESDPKKLAELEQELDLLEEKLDKKLEEQQKKEMELKAKEEKEKREEEEENDKKENDKGDSVSLSADEEEKKPLKEEDPKELLLKGSKKEKETENWKTSGKLQINQEKKESTVWHLAEEVEKEQQEVKSTSRDSKRLKAQSELVKTEKKSASWESSRDEDGGLMPEWKSVNTGRASENRSSRSSREEDGGGGGLKPEWNSVHTQRETESRSTRRHSSRSSREDEGEFRPKGTSMNTERESESRSTRRHSSRSDREAEKRGKQEVRQSEEEKRSHYHHHHHHSDRSESWRRRRQDEERATDHAWKDKKTAKDEHREWDKESRASRVESTKKRVEEEEKSREHRDSRKRGSERDSEHHHHHHSQRGSRLRSDPLLEDGLNI
ncbi:uncharacterized protein LOC114479162 isoform X6 [Gouania willdenowi]|uniref:uncharacterized protein LOC114479162 isoform X6 n=1 Tax=Gouania willdenowi TaxID=441366 RepID=UPI0010566B7C|nr:uncharacterized protein LOC114479162 isoform X6 [Gouania willdenowi]